MRKLFCLIAVLFLVGCSRESVPPGFATASGPEVRAFVEAQFREPGARSVLNDEHYAIPSEAWARAQIKQLPGAPWPVREGALDCEDFTADALFYLRRASLAAGAKAGLPAGEVMYFSGLDAHSIVVLVVTSDSGRWKLLFYDYSAETFITDPNTVYNISFWRL